MLGWKNKIKVKCIYKIFQFTEYFNQ